MCALLQVLQSDAEPTGVPPFIYGLPIANFFLARKTGQVRGRGTRREQVLRGALPLSYTRFNSRQVRTCDHPLNRRSICSLRHRPTLFVRSCQGMFVASSEPVFLAVPCKSGLRPHPARSIAPAESLTLLFRSMADVTRTYATGSYRLIGCRHEAAAARSKLRTLPGNGFLQRSGSRTPLPCGSSVQRSSCKVRHWQ